MKITRTINGKSVDIELSESEVYEAYGEYVKENLKMEAQSLLPNIPEDQLEEVAEKAYDIFTSIEAITEYEYESIKTALEELEKNCD